LPIAEKKYDELARQKATYWGRRAKEKSDAGVFPDLHIIYRAKESENLWDDSEVEAFVRGFCLQNNERMLIKR
jgi:hypothetical protein